MVFYHTFYKRFVGKSGMVEYMVKNVDLHRIESWEFFDPTHCKIVTYSGEIFVVNTPIGEMTDLMMTTIDPYGRIYEFNRN